MNKAIKFTTALLGSILYFLLDFCLFITSAALLNSLGLHIEYSGRLVLWYLAWTGALKVIKQILKWSTTELDKPILSKILERIRQNRSLKSGYPIKDLDISQINSPEHREFFKNIPIDDSD